MEINKINQKLKTDKKLHQVSCCKHVSYIKLWTCTTCCMLQTGCLSSTGRILWQVYCRNKFQVWKSWVKVPNKSCQRLWHYKSHHNGNPPSCLNHKCTSSIQQNQTGTDVNLWLCPWRSYYLSTLPFTFAYGVLCIQEKIANLVSSKFMWQSDLSIQASFFNKFPQNSTFHKASHTYRTASSSNLFQL